MEEKEEEGVPVGVVEGQEEEAVLVCSNTRWGELICSRTRELTDEDLDQVISEDANGMTMS
jgi:hypothetical protein